MLRRLFVVVVMIFTVLLASQTTLVGETAWDSCSTLCAYQGWSLYTDVGVGCCAYESCCWYENYLCSMHVSACAEFHNGCFCLTQPTWEWCNNCNSAPDIGIQFCVCYAS
jgi:hypothetical protein